jgi:hypothetical protein
MVHHKGHHCPLADCKASAFGLGSDLEKAHEKRSSETETHELFCFDLPQVFQP